MAEELGGIGGYYPTSHDCSSHRCDDDREADGKKFDAALLAEKSIDKHDNNDNGQIGKKELNNASNLSKEENNWLRSQGNDNGQLNKKELIDLQNKGIITISPDGTIKKGKNFDAAFLADKAIDKHEGTGVNRSPFNNDQQIGKWELNNTSGLSMEDNKKLRNDYGNKDGFLDKKELIDLQNKGIITISPDGTIKMADQTPPPPPVEVPPKDKQDEFAAKYVPSFNARQEKNGSGYSATYNTDTNQFTFTNSNNESVTVDFNTGSAMLGLTEKGLNTKFGELLGTTPPAGETDKVADSFLTVFNDRNPEYTATYDVATKEFTFTNDSTGQSVTVDRETGLDWCVQVPRVFENRFNAGLNPGQATTA